ncbi:MAG: GAK system CofD-like protein [Desulfovibrionaceae bacterium]|nr:GAK system CofD-like protein [Desulfovibrionaceae bacterium]
MTAPDHPAPARPLVFFTGGTALRELSRVLAGRSCRTAHLVTTFDSGGSTARLRKAFAMPAIGDLRNRLLALADVKACGADLVRCLETRLPAEGDADELRHALAAMADPAHPVWNGVGLLASRTLQYCLQAFLQAMPADFDARQASLGNVCMAGKYLLESRSLGSVLPLFARLLHTRGQVVPIVEESLHLAARLEDGSLLVGQHLFKELPSPIQEIFLTVYEPGRNCRNPAECRPRASVPALARLREAALVCYPMGSFFSSVLANLLADGIGHSVAALNCPKVFIPNTGRDGELLGHTVEEQLRILVSVLQRDCPTAAPDSLVSCVLVDRSSGRYQGDMAALERTARAMGVRVLDAPIIRSDGASHDADATADMLLELAGPAAEPAGRAASDGVFMPSLPTQLPAREFTDADRES